MNINFTLLVYLYCVEFIMSRITSFALKLNAINNVCTKCLASTIAGLTIIFILSTSQLEI